MVPTFLRQILDGGPVTVTSPDMTRYFMTIPEAVSLVLQSGAMADRGSTFLLDMGEPASILGLARQMIRLAGLRPDEDIAIEITGARPGERLNEQLWDDAEEHQPAGHPSISELRPKLGLDWDELVRAMEGLEHSCRVDDDAVRRSLTTMLRSCGVDGQISGATDDKLDLTTAEAADSGFEVFAWNRTRTARSRLAKGPSRHPDDDRPCRHIVEHDRASTDGGALTDADPLADVGTRPH